MSKAKKKQLKEQKQSAKRLVGYAAISIILTYLFASWAIDSGSLIVHVLAYLSVYYGVYYLKEAYKVRFRHDKAQ